MLTALLHKDLRICRLPLIVGLILLLAPFAMAAAVIADLPLWTNATPSNAWATLLGTGCYFSIMCSLPTLAMISGSIIAAERNDRSAEFLAYLPPSRKLILSSKAILLITVATLIAGLNLALLALAHTLATDTQTVHAVTTNLLPIHNLAAIGLAAAGAGWFASSIASTTGPPVTLAFAAPAAILGILAAIRKLTNWPSQENFSPAYYTTCIALGILTFTLGSLYYIRRVEP